VIVVFLEGDPDRPIIIGSVYNADTMPPYELPANKTRSGVKTDSSLGSGGFNEIRFEDKKGSEQIFIHGQKDSDTRIENDCREWIGEDRHLIVKRDKYDEVDRDRHIDIKRDHKEKIEGDRNLTVQGNKNMRISGSRSVQVTGSVAEKFSGNHSEQTSQDLYIQAQIIALEGETTICLTVGGNFISIGPSGINIVGSPMVNINSGGSPVSGTAGNLVSPAAPGAAMVADQAVAGSEVVYSGGGGPSAGGGGSGGGSGAGSSAGASSNAPWHDPNSDENKDKKHWIAIELLDDQNKPVTGEPYEIVLPDGSTLASGTTDEKGRARVDYIDPGQCHVRFPKREQSAIKPG
jgi:type VI secretion system secreted protein VgrG